ncbi:MAG: YciI family protein [Proteobacteria bacterium]|nr:YciI family protein [Pseudomonadota bacterium]
MLYTILCYHSEKVVGSWTPHQDKTVMEKLAGIQTKLAQQGKLGPVVRLMPTGTATTLRKEPAPVVLDGPFAETKEQLLGFYVVNVGSQDEAAAIARELAAVNPGGGCYEIRPVMVINPVHSGLLPAGATTQAAAGAT